MNTLCELFTRQIRPLILVLATLVGFAVNARAFVHPGIPFTTEDINQLKANINTAPWSTSYASFAGQSQSSLGYTGSPCAAVSRAPDVNLGAFRSDMIAIHNLTWMWLFTNNSAYAQRATDLLDAWALTNTYFGGDEACLDLGDYIEKLAPAADILKSMYPGWTAANTMHVNAWFTNVLWPVADVPNPVRGANQGAIQLKVAVSLAAFLDDTTKWSQAMSVYRDDAAGGLANSLSNGQLGDTGRDDGHWIGQLQALTWSAEVAWKQGVDMFSEFDNRLLTATELWAKWSTGQTLPAFIPNGGAYQFNYPGAYANGITPNIRQGYTYNIIENAYVRRLGLAAPETAALHAVTGDDAGTFLFRKSADTSTAARLPALVRPATAAATNLTDRDVGDVGLTGTASYDAGAGTWTVTGAGADIPIPPQTAVDAFNYAFQPISGDAAIVARVTSQQTGRAGIMIRESLAADAKYVGIFLNPNGGTVTTWRGATGWNKTNVSWNNPPGGYQSVGGPPAPWWLKIERLGTRVHVLHSPDGVNWSGLQSAEIAALPSTAYIGLCVTAQNASALSTATFDNVSLSPSGPAGAPAITSATAATTTVGTAFSYTITASGSPTSYAATGLPAGLSIDSTTGVISGTAVTPGTSLVTLSATNGSGTGTATLALTVVSDSAPVAPTGVTATAVNVYNVNIAWTASANATSYQVKRATTSGGPYTTIVTGVSGRSYKDTTAASGNVYYIVTALANSLESVPSSEASIAVPPGIPAALTVANGNSQVTLSWPAASGAASYIVKRATASGGPYTTIASGVTTTTYTDTGLTNGAYYYYVVTSVSSAESANSPEEFGLPGAATYTWSPTAASSSWNTAANWVEGVVPTSPAILKFGASTTTTLTNDIASGLEVARFTFGDDAPAYTITGNTITLGTEITNNSANRQTIQVPMVVSRTINSDPNAGEIMLGSLSAGSVISGSGGFVSRGDHPTSFLGANTFSGGVTGYGNALATDVFSPHTLSFSGIGTATYGPFGTGRVTLVRAVLTDTAPYVPSGTGSGLRNVLYNDIEITTGTQNAINTANGGALDHYGRLLGGGTVEVSGWNSGWDNYSGSPSFFGDNSGFTGTFQTFTHSSFQRIAFNTVNSGSAQARFYINGNINATHYIGANVSLGELSGAGAIRGNSTVTVGALNTDATWSGVLSLSLGITKVGSGTLSMTFANTYSGSTIVNGGTLRVNTPGSLTSAVTVNSGASFGGTGATSSTVTVNSGGKFVPGYQGNGIFAASGALTLAAGSTFGIEYSSSTGAGAGATAAQVTLNNATLVVTDVAPGTLPLGTVLTVINNTGSSAVSGTFNGLPEGSDVVVGANTFVITYRGGDGNDVVLHDKRTAALPAAPTGVSATTISAVQIDLAWNPAPQSDFVSVYTIKRAIVSGGPYAAVATVNAPHYSDTGVTYNTKYYYVITAGNYLGDSGISAEVSATTPPPPIPAAPANVVVAGGNGVMTLSWSAAFTAESYGILRATTPGGPYTTLATGVTGTTYNDTTAVNGTSYYYVVTASNGSGTSISSTEVGGAPAAGGYSYWPFNETSGSTSADVWGSRTATLASSNVTRVAGVSGNGLRFDGTSTSYATLPSGVVSSLTGDFTISAWVKFDALQNNQRILDFGSSTTNYMFISQNTGSTLRYGIKIGSPAEQGITTGTLPLAVGKWFHVAVTLSGTTTTIYINGVPAAAPTTAIANRPSGVTATANYFGKSQFADPLFKGTLDDARIYTRALTSTEIASMVSPLTPAAPANLVGTSAAGAIAPITLNWTASPQATNYNVKRATTAGGPYTVLASSVTGTTYVDTTATNGSYYYVVTAISGAFEGLASNEAAVTLLPAVVPASPAPVATGWNGRVDLNWAPAAGATSYDIKRATVSGGPFVTIGNVPYTSSSTAAALIYSDTTVTNGTAYYYVIAATNAAGSSANSAAVSATPLNDAVANTWAHTDVGAVGFSGNASYVGGVYTLYGSGADIWTQTDSFHFLYQPLVGNGAIMARVVTQSTTAETAGAAKAGVMIRETIAAVNSRIALVDHTPNNVVEYISRTATNVNATASTTGSIALPRWVKLVRSGTSFSAYYSADGVTWVQQGTSQTIAMGANTSIGLVFCANANGKRGQATFDHVSVATAAPIINSAMTAAGTVGVPFSYTIAATNTPTLFTATGLPTGLTLNDATGVISGTPTTVGTGTYNVATTAINAAGASSTATVALTISKGTAVVSLSNLAQSYDGTPKAAGATSTPAGLAVNLTYGGNAAAPTAAGSYAVVATVNDANYSGTASGTLVIAKAGSTATLGNLTQTYDGTAKSASVATTPSGLTVLYSFDGVPAAIAPPTGNLAAYAAALGQTVYVRATGSTTGSVFGSNDTGYAIGSDVGTAAVHAGVLTNGQSAVVEIAILADAGTYTGSTKNGVTTQSASASGGSFKIVGIANASDYTLGPIAAGNYSVTALIVDTNYAGTATGTLTIAQGAAVLDWSAPASIVYGTALGATQLNATASVPGTFVYMPAAGTVLDVGTDQTLSVSFTPSDTANYTSAGMTTAITVTQATAGVTLSGLSQIYDGSAKTVTVATAPAGLPVQVTYDGNAAVPINAGSYAVVVTVTDPNYSGGATGTLVIGKAVAAVSLGALSQTYNGSPKSATVATSPAGLPVVVTYDGNSTAPTNAGSYSVSAIVSHPNYAGSTVDTLVIGKATAAIALAPLAQAYDGTGKSVTATTTPASLKVNITYDGTANPPIYPGPHAVVATISEANYSGSQTGTLIITASVLVRHAPTVSSIIDGSMQVLLPESFTLKGGAMLSSDLLLPGTPTVQVNGSPTYAVKDGIGSATPANYALTLGGGAVVRYVVRHVDAISLPTVAAPPAPSGSRNVTIKTAGQATGDFSTLRNLTLNTGVGNVVVPAGAYGAFAANSGAGFVLGVAGATEPAIYNLQSLTLSGTSTLQVVGPVILTLGTGTTISGTAGNAAHPEWLTLNIYSGGVTLNAGATLRAIVTAPSGTVTLNDSATLAGRVIADRFTLNTNALLDAVAP